MSGWEGSFCAEGRDALGCLTKCEILGRQQAEIRRGVGVWRSGGSSVAGGREVLPGAVLGE